MAAKEPTTSPLGALELQPSDHQAATKGAVHDASTGAKTTEATSAPLETHYVEGLALVLAMGAVCVACFLALLDSSIIATAIPEITSEFHSLPDIGWYGAAFQISSAAIQPLVGKLYTQFSLKWTYIAFFAIFEVGSLVCGVAPSSKALIIGRAIAGIGVAGVFAGGLTIISSAISPEKRAVNTGIIMGVAQLGIVIGPLLGGAFTQHASWRWCFYINLPLGAIAVGGILFVTIANQQRVPPVMEAVRNLPRSLDLVGFVIFSGASVMLLLALEWGGSSYAWGSAVIIGLFCGSAALLLVFAGWSWRRGDEALIPPSLLKQRVVIACTCLTLFMMGANLTLSYWLPVYFQTVRGASPVTSGVNLLPSIVLSVVFAVIGGVLISKVGFYLPQAVVGTAVVTIGTGLITTLGPHTSTAKWAGYQALLGAGRGVMQQVPYTATPLACPPKMIPIAMSLMVFGQYIGGSIFLSLSNVIFHSSLKSSLLEYAPNANVTAIIAAGASASNVRLLTPPDELDGVIKAYSVSLRDVFYMATGSAGALFIAAFFVGWIDTRTATDKPKASDEKAERSIENS